MPLPPTWFRRVVFAPVALVGTAVFFVVLPVAGILALVTSRFVPGRWRPVRLLWFAINYLACEFVVLVSAFGLWIISGFGYALRRPWFERRHYWLLAWMLRRLVKVAERSFNVDIEVVERGVADPEAPRVVLARHAGPGDSLLLVHNACVRGREPRIVLKDTFQWEPMIDTLLSRLPCRFVSPNPKAGDDAIAGIAQLAATMERGDSLIIFPEGGNVTASRRLKSIARLREAGHEDEAAAAQAMRHVMAPRPGGALAALEACPAADVIFVGHTGLEDLSSAVDLWRGIPMDAAVRAVLWHEPHEAIPEGLDAQVDWLFGWWAKIDRWIDDTRAEQWSL